MNYEAIAVLSLIVAVTFGLGRLSSKKREKPEGKLARTIRYTQEWSRAVKDELHVASAYLQHIKAEMSRAAPAEWVVVTVDGARCGAMRDDSEGHTSRVTFGKAARLSADCGTAEIVLHPQIPIRAGAEVSVSANAYMLRGVQGNMALDASHGETQRYYLQRDLHPGEQLTVHVSLLRSAR